MGNTTSNTASNSVSNTASNSASIKFADNLINLDQLDVNIAEFIRDDKLSDYRDLNNYINSLDPISSVAKNNNCFYILKYNISLKDDMFTFGDVSHKLKIMDESIISKIKS